MGLRDHAPRGRHEDDDDSSYDELVDSDVEGSYDESESESEGEAGSDDDDDGETPKRAARVRDPDAPRPLILSEVRTLGRVGVFLAAADTAVLVAGSGMAFQIPSPFPPPHTPFVFTSFQPTSSISRSH